jgi:hypothetical protein
MQGAPLLMSEDTIVRRRSSAIAAVSRLFLLYKPTVFLKSFDRRIGRVAAHGPELLGYLWAGEEDDAVVSGCHCAAYVIDGVLRRRHVLMSEAFRCGGI